MSLAEPTSALMTTSSATDGYDESKRVAPLVQRLKTKMTHVTNSSKTIECTIQDCQFCINLALENKIIQDAHIEGVLEQWLQSPVGVSTFLRLIEKQYPAAAGQGSRAYMLVLALSKMTELASETDDIGSTTAEGIRVQKLIEDGKAKHVKQKKIDTDFISSK